MLLKWGTYYIFPEMPQRLRLILPHIYAMLACSDLCNMRCGSRDAEVGTTEPNNDPLAPLLGPHGCDTRCGCDSHHHYSGKVGCSSQCPRSPSPARPLISSQASANLRRAEFGNTANGE